MSGGRKRHPISVKLNLKVYANLVVSERMCVTV